MSIALLFNNDLNPDILFGVIESTVSVYKKNIYSETHSNIKQISRGPEILVCNQMLL